MESPIAESTHSFHPCNHSPWRKHWVTGESGWLIYTGCHLLHLKIKCLLCSICYLASFTWATSIFRVNAHPERSFHIPLPQASLSPIFHTCFFQVPDIQPNCTTVHIMKVDPHFWPSLPPNKVTSACTPGSAYSRIFLHHSPSGSPLIGAVKLQLSTSSSMRISCTPRPLPWHSIQICISITSPNFLLSSTSYQSALTIINKMLCLIQLLPSTFPLTSIFQRKFWAVMFFHPWKCQYASQKKGVQNCLTQHNVTTCNKISNSPLI